MKSKKISRPAKKFSRRRKKEIEFLSQIVEKKPDYIEALELLSEIYTKSGDIESGIDIDRRLIFLQPFEPSHYYNLACDYALSGKKDKALLYLKIAIILGFNDFDYMNRDPDLACLKGDKEYERLIKRFSSRRIK